MPRNKSVRYGVVLGQTAARRTKQSTISGTSWAKPCEYGMMIESGNAQEDWARACGSSGPRHSRLATRGAMAKVGRESSGARREGDRGSHVSGHAKIVFITWHTCVVLQKVQEREAGILLRGIIVYVIVMTPHLLLNTSCYGSTHSTWLTHSNWLCVAFSNSK